MDIELIINTINDFTEFALKSDNYLFLDILNYGIKYKNVKESDILKLSSKEQLLLRSLLEYTKTKIILE